MNSKLCCSKTKNTQLNNKGSALVVVIIALGLIGILASTLMYMSMMNYQMKVNNLRAKDNFYSAETVLDEIRMGMEGKVSSSVQAAYHDVLIHFDETTVEEKQNRMRRKFLSKIEESYATGAGHKTYDLKKLYEYLEKTESVFVDGNFSEGAILETNYNGTTYQIMKNAAGDYVDSYNNLVPEAKGKMETFENSVVFYDIKVTYTDANGYVSVIETDIRVMLPDLDFVQSVTLPALSNYSLVAQENIEALPVAANRNLTSVNRIAGSFYADRLLVGTNEANEQDPTVSVQLEEYVGSPNEDKRMVVAEDVYVGAGAKLTADQYGELWANSIYMNGAHSTTSDVASEVQFLGNDVFLADDVVIQGDKNYFKAGHIVDGRYAGKFVGYGSGSDSESSSSIVINGTDTELHFEELTNLTLAGNAYIGLSDGGITATSTDDRTVPMGQSIAVKSDQIAYLIPAECLGIDGDTGQQIVSNMTNPMTLESYQAIVAEDNYVEVSNIVPCAALGGKTLADYGIDTSGSNPMYQKYFKRVTSQITLVYYYVLFDNDAAGKTAMNIAANQYFQDYYQVNKATMDAYNKLYTDNIQIRDSAMGFYTLHLAGNLVRYDSADTLAIKEATAVYDQYNASYQSQLVANQTKFLALTKKLIDVYDLLSAAEKADTANVYTNLVDVAEITSFVTAAVAEGEYGTAGAYYFGDAEGKAVIVDGDYTYSETTEAFSGLIIATGDVTLARGSDFKGTILAGGSIILDKDANAAPDKDAVTHALMSYKQIGTDKYYVTDFLFGGEGYLSSESQGYLKSDVDLGELIVYENWQKQ